MEIIFERIAADKICEIDTRQRHTLCVTALNKMRDGKVQKDGFFVGRRSTMRQDHRQSSYEFVNAIMYLTFGPP